jgi:hypothetical protein
MFPLASTERGKSFRRKSEVLNKVTAELELRLSYHNCPYRVRILLKIGFRKETLKKPNGNLSNNMLCPIQTNSNSL